MKTLILTFVITTQLIAQVAFSAPLKELKFSNAYEGSVSLLYSKGKVAKVVINTTGGGGHMCEFVSDSVVKIKTGTYLASAEGCNATVTIGKGNASVVQDYSSDCSMVCGARATLDIK